jgi:hypothetical protein
VTTEQLELRAERLRVAVVVLDCSDDYDAGLYAEARPLIPRHQNCLFATCSAEERQLAESVLELERSFRDSQWDGLQALLGAIPPGGDLDSIFDLPACQALPALRAAIRCGWFRPGA